MSAPHQLQLWTQQNAATGTTELTHHANLQSEWGGQSEDRSEMTVKCAPIASG